MARTPLKTADACDGADDLVVTPHAIYYTASLSGNVDRLDRRSGEMSSLGYVGLGVNPIAFSPDGRLLAGIAPGAVPILAPLFNGLFEVDPTGVRAAQRVVADSSSINAFCVTPDGLVYGPAPNSVVRIDVERDLKTIVSEGFGYSAAVRFNPRDRRLYVLDVSPAESPSAPILYSMQLDGSERRVFARLSNRPRSLYAADNFAIARDGTFYVTRFDPIITRISPDATRIEDFQIGRP